MKPSPRVVWILTLGAAFFFFRGRIRQAFETLRLRMQG